MVAKVPTTVVVEGGSRYIKMSYYSVDDPTTWTQAGNNPGSYPTGATGGNNGVLTTVKEGPYGGQGGQGWGGVLVEGLVVPSITATVY